MSEVVISKTYLCPIIGSGTIGDPWRPKVAILDLKCSWFMHELTADMCLVTIVSMQSDHAVIVQDSDFELIMVQDNIVVPPPRFAELQTAYPNIEEKLGTTIKCSIKFMEVYGK